MAAGEDDLRAAGIFLELFLRELRCIGVIWLHRCFANFIDTRIIDLESKLLDCKADIIAHKDLE